MKPYKKSDSMMETRDYSKSGASLKSQTSRGNFKNDVSMSNLSILLLFILLFLGSVGVGCAQTLTITRNDLIGMWYYQEGGYDSYLSKMARDYKSVDLGTTPIIEFYSNGIFKQKVGLYQPIRDFLRR